MSCENVAFRERRVSQEASCTPSSVIPVGHSSEATRPNCGIFVTRRRRHGHRPVLPPAWLHSAYRGECPNPTV